MKGLILTNAYSSDPAYLYQPKRLKEELEKAGCPTDVKRNDFFPAIVENGVSVSLEGYDFCIFLDKDKYILEALSLAGINVFNSYDSILACDDKMTTYFLLAKAGIKVPKTLPGLLCYEKNANEPVKEETVRLIENELRYPMVIKYSYGSLGEGVFLIKDKAELVDKLSQVKCSPHLIQEFISSSYGKDLRVMVVGGKAVGAMLRQSDGDFRSNIGAGGHGENYPLTKEISELAEEVSAALGLDYCGVDLLFDKDGFVVCEVNSNSFFSGFEKATGINVAKIYANYVLEKVSKTV